MPAPYDPDRERKRIEAEMERERRARERERKAEEARRKAARIASSKETAARTNDELDQTVDRLNSFLVTHLAVTSRPSLDGLRRVAAAPALDLGPLALPLDPPRWADYAPAPAGLLKRTFSQASVVAQDEQARKDYDDAVRYYQYAEGERRQAVATREREHAQEVEELEEDVASQNAALDELIARARGRDRTAVERFVLDLLSLAPRPTGTPLGAQATFDVDNEHVVIEVELPTPEVVPEVKSVKFAPTKDEIVGTARPARERNEIYGNLVSQICLLVLRTVFNADESLREISLNARVRHINPATGHEERPYLISVRVERDAFGSLVLDRVRPGDCLKHLRARVSNHPFELEPVEPVADFEKSRVAFVAGRNMVAGLDERPDLMAMSPTEFEYLIRDLFEADPTIDEVKSLVTQQSNDGGMDGVIYVKQPLGRSMTIVQVKQYSRSHRLGPVHVRELIGSMHETKAGNGLLVTTSSFTPTARANADAFGRIMLIDGANLVYLIKKHLGKDVLIGERPPRQ